MTHDEMAALVGDAVLQKIRSQEKGWKQIFSSTLHRIGDWGWPRPDYVCEDNKLNVTYAMEFKPPGQSKREYLTGLGQALGYLLKHNYSALIVPRLADDKFDISSFIAKMLSSDILADAPISLIVYDETLLESNPAGSISIAKIIKKTRTGKVIHAAGKTETFWCWWRDTSNYELFQLLSLSDHFRDAPGDIYTNNIFPLFFKLLTSGKTLQWDGTPRRKAKTSKQSEKQNNKIPLFHLGLWNQADGRLTLKGYKLLVVGKIYGPASVEFMNYLTYLILVDGRHYDLIKEVLNFQRLNEGSIPKKSEEFLFQLEKYLDSKGLIGPRKPSAVTTGAKPSYIRDEPKLWNKLNLLERSGANYFIPNVGFCFNWERITDILKEGNKLLGL